MSSLNIGIDIDGILAQFESGFRRKLYEVRKVPAVLQVTHLDITTWDWPQSQFGYTDEEVSLAWAMVKSDPCFWSSLDPHEDAREFLETLGTLARRHDHHVYFITHRTGFRARHQTELWLRMMGWDHERPTVLLAEDKGTVCRIFDIHLYIDDKNENVASVLAHAPKTRGFMLARPWNMPIAEVPRLTRLQEFYVAIEARTVERKAAS
jgi:hypothetical protein